MIKLGKTRIMFVFLILACLVDRVQAETWASEEEWNLVKKLFISSRRIEH